MVKKSEKIYGTSHKVYVCLDTNIIISLAGLHYQNEYEISQMQKFGQFQDMCDLKKLVDKKEIIAVVTPIVFEEILQGVEKYGDETLHYLQKSNIKILDIPDDKLKAYFGTVERVATTYSGRLTHDTIQKICVINNITNFQKFPQRVFKLVKTESGEPAVQNDARIMAEAGLFGVALITNNSLDFINHNRQEILRYINQKIHLPSKAIPFTAKDFLRRFRYNQVFASPKPENLKYLKSSMEIKPKKTQQPIEALTQ